MGLHDAPAPEPRDYTLGVVPINEYMAMPPFAVDILAAQGNGDVTDAVIALRGAITNDAGLNPADVDFSQPFVALDRFEARLVAAALDAARVAGNSRYLYTLAQDAYPLDDGEDAGVALSYLAARVRMVPGAERKG